MSFDLLTAARELVAIDTRSHISDTRAADYLAHLAAELNLTTRVLREVNGGVEQCDLFVSPPGFDHADPATLMLCAHLDTVSPGDPALWTSTGGDPWALTQHGDMLHGLGSADDKLATLCQIGALADATARGLDRPAIVAATYGEENGRHGAKLLVRELTQLPAMALVGEPSGLRVCTAHKGYAEVHVETHESPTVPSLGRAWELSFQGASAHSSQPHRGQSATDTCLDALAFLRSRQPVCVLLVEGGDAINKVPAKARAVVTCTERPDVPGATVQELDEPSRREWSPDLIELLLRLHERTKLLRESLLGIQVTGFDPPFSSVNNGIVRVLGGTLRYIVDVRCVPAPNAEDLYGDYARDVALASAESTTGAQTEQRLVAAPFKARQDSTLLPALDAALIAGGLPVGRELKSGTTEATVYADAGMDVIIFGPGEAAGNIHRPNECVPLSELQAARATMSRLISRLCGGG